MLSISGDHPIVLIKLLSELDMIRGGSRKLVWERHNPWRARGMRAYNGGLEAKPPAGSRHGDEGS